MNKRAPEEFDDPFGFDAAEVLTHTRICMRELGVLDADAELQACIRAVLKTGKRTFVARLAAKVIADDPDLALPLFYLHDSDDEEELNDLRWRLQELADTIKPTDPTSVDWPMPDFHSSDERELYYAAIAAGLDAEIACRNEEREITERDVRAAVIRYAGTWEWGSREKAFREGVARVMELSRGPVNE